MRLASTDVVALFMENLPDDEIRSLRDNIAKAENELAGPIWDHAREQHKYVVELRDKCEKASHFLTIVLAGNAGTRRRLVRNGWNERRICIMCGTEEEGTLVTGSLRRFLLRKAAWKFEKLNRQAARTFTDPQWYFETCGIVRNFSFPTAVVLAHAFPPRVPFSYRQPKVIS